MAKNNNMIGFSMQEIKDLVVRSFIKSMEFNRAPRSYIVVGEPGSGKSDTFKAVAREVGEVLDKECDYVSFSLPNMEPVDVGGIPHILQDGDYAYADYIPFYDLYRATKQWERAEGKRKSDRTWKANPMVINIDDMPMGHEQTINACCRIIQDRMIGRLEFRENVLLVATGNRIEDNAGAHEIQTAMANRLRWITATPSTDGWISWAIENNIHPMIIAFLRGNQNCLTDFSPEIQGAQTTARSWHNLSDAMHEFDGNVDFKLIAGIIGLGMANNFNAFLKGAKGAVSPELIVKDPKKAPIPNRNDLDSMHATVASLERYVLDHPQYCLQATQYSVRKEMLKDLGIILATLILKIGTDETKISQKEIDKLMSDDVYAEMLGIYGDALTAEV